MATTNLTNNNVNNNGQPMDTNTAAAILAQFDQNTQLQALAMLRQLNAQQQLQQIQRLQQLQQLQALQALQRINIDDKTEGTNHTVNDNTKMVISSATRPPKQLLSQNNSLSSSSQTNNSTNFTPSFNNKEIYSPTVKINNNKISSSSFQVTNKALSPRSSMIGSNYTTATSNNLTFQPIKKEIGPDGEEFIVPSDDMVDQIVIASEYYFSDENLAKDHYLLRQICQKSEGFLSIKLLTALKNVKRLTKDWRVTSAALKKSTKLMLNSECTKVKRIAALPDHVLKARQITNVIAIRIPMEFSSVSSITQLFAQFGKITLVRVLLPGRQVPCDLRNYATQVPDMGNSLCAVVEYETETEACTACRDLNAKRYNSGLRAALLGPRLRRNLYKAIPESEQAGDNFNQNPATFSELSTNNNTWNKAVVVNGSAQIIDDSKAQKGTSLSNSSSGVSSGKNGNTKDSGCDSASNHSSGSPPSLRKDTFDRAPGAHRKSVKMQINISSNGVAVIRQPKGPTSGSGFKNRSTGVAC